jgi:ankyrin repeat protein
MKFQPFLIPVVLSLLPNMQAAALFSVDALTQFCAKALYQKLLEFLAESSNGDDSSSIPVQPFNELDSNGFGCLHAAILAHNKANVYALITRAAELNLNLNLHSSSIKGSSSSSSSSSSSLTVLQLAAISGQSKVFKYFLFCFQGSKADVLPNLLAVRDELGRNLLHLALAHGHVAIVHLLAHEKPAFLLNLPMKREFSLPCLWPYLLVMDLLLKPCSRVLI